jgi:hypothetical protein
VAVVDTGGEPKRAKPDDAGPRDCHAIPARGAPWALFECKEMQMDQELLEALRIVLDLGRQNVISEHDDVDEYNRQIEACNKVEAFIYFNTKS